MLSSYFGFLNFLKKTFKIELGYCWSEISVQPDSGSEFFLISSDKGFTDLLACLLDMSLIIFSLFFPPSTWNSSVQIEII